MIRVTRPVGINLIDWCDQVVMDLSSYGNFGRLNNPDQWQDWAVQFLNNPSFRVNLPNPYQFNNWKEWAERFCEMLS